MQSDLLPAIETHDEPVPGARLTARLAELKRRNIRVEWMSRGDGNAMWKLHYHAMPVVVFARQPEMICAYDSLVGF